MTPDDLRRPGSAPPVVAAIEAVAAAHPDRIAVSTVERTWTYRDLLDGARTLATALGAEGSQGARVALRGAKTGESVIGLLGTWLAGMVVVPFDHSIPRERLRSMLDRTGAALVLDARVLPPTDEATGGHGSEPPPVAITAVLGHGARMRFGPPSVGAPLLDDPDAAYVCFTSGSTGRPKGVVGSHASIDAYCRWHVDHLGFGPTDRVAQLVGLSFDAALKDILPTLLAGGCIVMPPEQPYEHLRAAMGRLDDEAVTVIQVVPTAATLLLGAMDPPRSLGALRLLVLAGEPLRGGLVTRWRTACPDPALRIENMFGPTEATVLVTAASIADPAPDELLAVGFPRRGTELVVMDDDGSPVPVGRVGEVWIRSHGLALGYLDGAPGGFGPPTDGAGGSGPTRYRTGDLGHLEPDGALVIDGRLDHQVKVNGVRVDPDEVAGALARLPAVDQAAVVSWEDAHGQTRLGGFLVGPHPHPGIDQLVARLLDVVPAAMVPSRVVWLDALPTLGNGKVDRARLARTAGENPVHEPERTGGAAALDGSDSIDARLATIWRDLLDGATAGPDDDFFELGGHSLLLIRLLARIEDAWGVEVPLAEVFAVRTIRGQGRLIDDLLVAGGGPAAVKSEVKVAPPADGEPFALTSGQLRLWLAAQLDPTSPAYVMCGGLVVRGPLDASDIVAALEAVANRHESLRVSVAEVDGSPVQRIAPPGPGSFPCSHVDDEGEVATVGRTPFDLGGRLVRARLLRRANGEHVVGMAVHHIVCDAESWTIVVDDLAELLGAAAARRPPALAPAPSWQARCSGRHLEAELGVPGDPAERGEPGTRTDPSSGAAGIGAQAWSGRRLTTVVPAALASGFLSRCRALGVTSYQATLAVTASILARHTGSGEVSVLTDVTERAGRDDERLVGYCVSTPILAVDTTAASWRDLAIEVRDRWIDRCRDPVAASTDRPSTFVRMAPTVLSHRSVGPVEVTTFDLFNGAAKFDLSVAWQQVGAGLRVTIEHRDHPGGAARADALQDHLLAALAAFAEDPDRPPRTLTLSGPQPEPARELTAVPQPNVVAAFAAQVARRPTATAILYPGGSVSYAALADRADAWVEHLDRLGVGRGARVAIIGGKRVDTVAAMVAVLADGAVMVPIDEHLPAPRRDTLARLSGAVHQLDTTTSTPSMPARFRHPGPDPINAAATTVGDQPAYVFFTSGTTGDPVGLLGRADSLGHFVSWERRELDIGPTDRVAQLTTISFDAVLRDVFLPLTSGATLCLPEDDWAEHPLRTLRWFDQLGVTVVHTVPSVAASWVAVCADEPAATRPRLASLRVLALAGEPLSGTLLDSLRDTFPACTGEVVNLYGPTETTMIRSFARVSNLPRGLAAVPVGRALPDSEVLVLDEDGRVCGTSERGEVWIRTAYATRGRIDGEPGRFVADPFGLPGACAYRTGDIGWVEPDGSIVVAGRLDDEVKVNGVRVQPAEVAAIVATHPSVGHATVLAEAGHDGTARLTAFVHGHDPFPDPAALRRFVAERAPRALVPSRFVRMPTWPLLPNGKVDRDALGRAGTQTTAIETASDTDSGAPAGPLIEEVTAIFAEVLDGRRLRPDDDFFEHGGHSLLATVLLTRVRRRFEVRIPLRALFAAPTVRHVADLVRTARSASTGLDADPASAAVGTGPATGSAPPLVLLPGLGGSPWWARPMAATLAGRRPVVAIELAGAGPTDVAALARLVLQQVPAGPGPVHLVGWSFGGLVALEAAGLLADAGRPVGLVALLDSWGPGRAYPDDDARLLEHLLSDLRHASSTRPLAAGPPPRPANPALDPVRTVDEQVARAYDRAVRDGLVGPGDLDGFDRLVSVMRTHAQAARAHRPRGAKVPITLVLAADQPAAARREKAEAWSLVAAQGCEVISVPGDHHSMVADVTLATQLHERASASDRVADPTP